DPTVPLARRFVIGLYELRNTPPTFVQGSFYPLLRQDAGELVAAIFGTRGTAYSPLLFPGQSALPLAVLEKQKSIMSPVAPAEAFCLAKHWKRKRPRPKPRPFGSERPAIAEGSIIPRDASTTSPPLSPSRNYLRR